MPKWTNIITEVLESKKGYNIERVIECIEVAPSPGHNGGCILRTRSKYRQRYLRIFWVVSLSESTIFIESVTIKQLKG